MKHTLGGFDESWGSRGDTAVCTSHSASFFFSPFAVCPRKRVGILHVK